MTKIFISFLGSTPYVHCRYKWIDGEQKSNPVRYVQEAIAGFLCKDWDAEDKIRIFTTKGEEGSLEKNWKQGAYYYKEGEEKELKEKGISLPSEVKTLGLRNRLKMLELKCDIKNVVIPDGAKENDIWEVIQEIVNEIEGQAEVYFDITHSFRFLPMIVPAIISFLKTTKKITLGGIYYGVLEVLGSPNKVAEMELDDRIAPIRELKEIYEMIEWSEAVNNFVHFGDERKLVEVINNIKSYSKLDEVLEKKLTDLTERIQELGEALRLNDLWKLKEIAEKEKVSFVEDINLENNPELYPLKEIGKKIEDYLNQWESDVIKNGFLAAKWHIENKRIARALVFANEEGVRYISKYLKGEKWLIPPKSNIKNVVNYLIKVFSSPVEEQEKIINEHENNNNEKLEARFKNNAGKGLEILKNIEDIAKGQQKINTWRNVISHANKDKQDKYTRQEIKQELPELINAFLKELNLPLINEEDHA